MRHPALPPTRVRGVLLVPTWLALGLLAVLYVLAMVLLALLAVVAATARLLLGPVLTLSHRVISRW